MFAIIALVLALLAGNQYKNLNISDKGANSTEVCSIRKNIPKNYERK